VVEIRPAGLDVVLAQADRETLDRLVPPGHGARPLRTAPDELLFVVPAGSGTDVVRELEDRIAALEPDGLVLDVSDGWVGWTLSGPGAVRAFAAVSPLAAPAADAFVQGDVARVGAKVLGEADGALTILVPSPVGDHLVERLRADARADEVRP
jgi:hypothetical protein